MPQVGEDEIEEEDIDSLLESIGEELSTEKLDELEKQWLQLEEEVEAEQHLMAPPMKQLTMSIFRMLNQALDYMEEVDLTTNRRDL